MNFGIIVSSEMFRVSDASASPTLGALAPGLQRQLLSTLFGPPRFQPG
jgi:hypothetical protein